MLGVIVSTLYLTRIYQFDMAREVHLVGASPLWGGSYLLSLRDTSGNALLMGVDSLGVPLSLVGFNYTQKMRRLRYGGAGVVWGVSGNYTVRIYWPDSLVGISTLGTDIAISVRPIDDSTAVSLGFRDSFMSKNYRLLLIEGDSAVVRNVSGISPNIGRGDIGLLPSSAGFVVAMAENGERLYVVAVNRNIDGFSWENRIEFDGRDTLYTDGEVFVAIFPNGWSVVAYTLDSASATRWGYTLFDNTGRHVRSAKLYPTGYDSSNHYVSGVAVLNDTLFAIYGSSSDPSTFGTVVVVDTAGNTVASYAITATSSVGYLSREPYGHALIGYAPISTVVFSRQSDRFGPCDTASVPFTSIPLSVSVDPVSLSLSSPTFSSISTYTDTPSAEDVPATSLICSQNVSSTDTTSPHVLTTYPSDGATGVPDTTTIHIYFSEPIDTTTFNNSTVSVSPVGSYSPSCPTDTSCTITHTPFPPGTTITVSLSSDITDTAGNGLTPYTFSFSTALPPSGTLEVVLTSPDSGEINVPLNANVGVWFSDEVDVSTVNSGSIRIHGWDGSSIAYYTFTVTCPTDLFCVLDPSPLFRPSEVVTVEFTDSIKARSGGTPLTPKVITFRTQEVDTLRPVVVFTVPDSGATGVPTNTNVGVQFSRDMDTTSIAGNVIITGSTSGSHGYFVHCPTQDYCSLDPYPDFTVGEEVRVELTDDILDEDGRRLVPKVVIFTVGSGEDNTPPIVQIISPPNDTITLYNAGELIRAYVSDPGGIQRVDWVLLDRTYSKPTDCNGSLYSDPDTSCLPMPPVPSGVYLLKAFAYDRSNNVGYDSVWVSFNDTVPPYLVLTEPSDGDVAVSPHTDIRLVFSEDMDTTTFGSVRIRVGTTTYTYSHLWEEENVLLLRPATPFPYDSVVKVRVDSFVDLSGNRMLPDSFSFRIVSNASVSSLITSVSPDTVYVGSGDSVEVVGVVLSTYPITGAELILDGDSTLPMEPLDGAYDEVEETVAVKIYTEKEGTHTVVIRGHNAYDYGTSPTANFYVLRVPFLSKENVVVYPNPTKGRAKVRFVLGGDAYATVEVFDLKARKMFSVSDMYEGFKPYVITLPQLPPGLYLLRIRAKGRRVEVWFSVVR